MGARTHRDTVEHAIELWNAHDDRYFEEVYTEDLVTHGFPGDAPPTRDGMRALFHQMWESFPDIRVELQRFVSEGDLAAANLRISGTHEGEFMGAAPTGKRIEVDAMAFFRFDADGKVAERWTRLDEVGLLTQLGLMQAQAGAPA
ncbi:MAG TPA: ester cyclase [Gaiellaceae bacterium]|nr:ester cyclase [Gaiellaceae bacterium]